MIVKLTKFFSGKPDRNKYRFLKKFLQMIINKQLKIAKIFFFFLGNLIFLIDKHCNYK